MNTSKYIIGKIPGYNSGILPDSSNNTIPGDYYKNRLLNNLNIIDFIPTGYSLQFNGDIPDALKFLANASTNDALNKAKSMLPGTNTEEPQTELSEENKLTVKSAINKLKEVSRQLLESINVTTSIADGYWHELLSLSAFGLGKRTTLKNGFIIQGTNDSTVNEVISTEYGTNFFQERIEELGKQFADSTVGKMAGLAIGAYKSYDSSAGIALLRESGEWGLLGALSGSIQGVKINLPQTFRTSDYNSSMNIIVKLISPSGDSESIRKYIKEPLEVLIRAAAPYTQDGLMYGYPMIWEVRAHGLMHFKLASITAITITRGGNDTVFNKYDEPLNIDVRMMITPINPGFAQGPLRDYTMTDPSDVSHSMSSLIYGNFDGNDDDSLYGVYRESAYFDNDSKNNIKPNDELAQVTTKNVIDTQKIYI